MVGLMEFYPSVDDDEKYTRIIEPWFLNALNKLSDSRAWVIVRKVDVFDEASKAHLGGFKGDKKQLENYIGKRGSDAYWCLVENVVDSLVNRNFIKRAENRAEVMIRKEGIDICNREDEIGWHSSRYPID